jgi:predicted RNase H-like nuclease (RuvC/YqgF family)
LPPCPSCGTAIAAPSKVFTVIVEPKEGERGLTQRKVGMYSCEKCGTKFPTVVSRQHYLVVPDDQMAKIQTDIKSLKKTNQDLEKRVQMMDKEYADLQKSLDRNKKDSETRILEAKLDALEKHVAYLRKEKGELEEKATRLR